MTEAEADLSFMATLERYAAAGKQVGTFAAAFVLARQHKGNREMIEEAFASALGRLLKSGMISVVKTANGENYLRSERKLTSVPPRQEARR